MADNLVIESPDFDQIREEAGYGTEDAVRLLWYTLNQEISDRRNQRFRWMDATYATIGFSASAGTWTVASGDFVTYNYAILGDFILVQFLFQNTSTSAGMGNVLEFTLPGGLKGVAINATGFGFATGVITEPAVVGIYPSPNNNKFTVIRSTGVAWPSSATDTLTVQGMIIVQIQHA